MDSFPTAPADPPVWADDRLAAPPPPAALAAEVAVVGGGVVALRAAAALARQGARVVLLAPGPDLSAASERTDGLVLGAFDDNAWRLVQALGPAVARELVAWADAGAAALGMAADGLVLGALVDAEQDELDQSAALRRDWGLPAEAVGPSPGWAGGIRVRGGALDPWALAVSAAQDARAAGAQLFGRAPVRAHEDSDQGNVLVVPQGRLVADLVLLCGDHQLAGAWPWLGDKLVPVRHQHRHHAAGALDGPRSAQFGYLSATPAGAGVILGGCRWATPHLETGEDAAERVRLVVDEKIAALWGPRVAGLSPEPTARWSRVATHSCDGLPLVGPLPGRPTVVACLGFNGRPHTHLGPAVDAVVEGILDGRPSALPRLMRPDRFVG